MNENEVCRSDEPQECCEKQPDEIPKRNKKIRETTIRELGRGYVLQVGCNNFAVESKEKVIELLCAYIKDPEQIEKDFFDGKLLK